MRALLHSTIMAIDAALSKPLLGVILLLCVSQVLELFNHPFVLRLYTTFQDANRVYFLTELLEGGELWSVIYEGSSGFDAGKFPRRRDGVVHQRL